MRGGVKSLDSINELRSWLTEKGIDTNAWGVDQAKRIVDLWQEVASGEAGIQDNPPLRILEVVRVIIRREKSVLVEAEQELGGGRQRWRNQFPAEKMKQGESYTDAALRCLKEELGVDEAQVTLLPSTYQKVEETAESVSYPGLTTHYTFHIVEARVDGLPQTDFWRDNVAFNHGDPVKRHRWVWRPLEQRL
jgi:ADP-ribose pyrophosphatase YjhB (NUDIX family)